ALGWKLLAAAAAKRRRAQYSLCEERIGMNREQSAESTAVEHALRRARPRLGDEREHVTFDAGFLHSRREFVGFAQLRDQRLIQIQMLAGLGATNGNAATALRWGAHADDVDFLLAERLIQIGDVGHVKL